MEFRPAIIPVTIIHTVYRCPGYAKVRELFILVSCELKTCMLPKWLDNDDVMTLAESVCVSHKRCCTSALAAVVSDCIVFRL